MGSAVLTLVILCGFAAIVGVLTSRRIHTDFNRQVADAADDLKRRIRLVQSPLAGEPVCEGNSCPDLTDYAAGRDALIRLVYLDGDAFAKSREAPYLGPPIPGAVERQGFRIESRALPVGELCCVYIQYARRLSDVEATAGRVRFFLAVGVLGGAALALLAGLATARRAMAPIAELTDATREIERTRDLSRRIPLPEARDEVFELAATLDSMLRSLDRARSETESALSRQREFVADASHELRTPLTSVLANLELLEAELEGEQRDVAESALRSTRRMRRLVADLLLLARADAGRVAPHGTIDVSTVVVEAASELEPLAGDHQISVSAPPGMAVEGARDELHRLVLNLLENALEHTPASAAVHAEVRRTEREVILDVEDEGAGVPPELRERIFERFVRGAADRGGSTGLGLAIVKAVAESHGGTVRLEPGRRGEGARFVVRLPISPRVLNLEPGEALSAQ